MHARQAKGKVCAHAVIDFPAYDLYIQVDVQETGYTITITLLPWLREHREKLLPTLIQRICRVEINLYEKNLDLLSRLEERLNDDEQRDPLMHQVVREIIRQCREFLLSSMLEVQHHFELRVRY